MQTTATTTTISNGYTTTTTQTVVSPNIYDDKGCNGNRNCANYSVYVECMPDLYHGIDACQTLYILDKDGQPVDLDRLDKVEIMAYNEYDCIVLTSATGISIENMQKTYDGDLFEITPDNYYDMSEKYFDAYNVSIKDNNPDLICPDDIKAIVIGESDGESISFGQIIFNPIEYNGDIFIEVEPNESNFGKCVCMVNGLPQYIKFNQKNKLLNILNDCKDSIISLTSFGPNFEQTIAYIDKIKFSCAKGITDKGKLKLCYSGAMIPKIPGVLTAEIILTFNADDETEKGSSKVISCVKLANIKHSVITDAVLPNDESDAPIYSGITVRIVDALPVAGWNTTNSIYLMPAKNKAGNNTMVEYLTIKTKNGEAYSYHWEKVGDTYTLSSLQKNKDAAINLTNKDDVNDSVIIKYKEDDTSQIEFNANGDAITSNITKIDGGVL